MCLQSLCMVIWDPSLWGTSFIPFMMILIVQMPSRCIFDATEFSNITITQFLTTSQEFLCNSLDVILIHLIRVEYLSCLDIQLFFAVLDSTSVVELPSLWKKHQTVSLPQRHQALAMHSSCGGI